MFFRRARIAEPDFQQRIETLKSWGVQARPEPDGALRVGRDGCTARVRQGSDGRPLVEGLGWLLGDEPAVLVDEGYQKFWLSAGGQRQPALAEQLKTLHNFEEDLREALGLASLYNTSLGTVNTLHLYDRPTARDDRARS